MIRSSRRRARRPYKAKFTPEFVERIKISVEKCSLELTLVDIGGITSVENEAICSGATHIVILAGDTKNSGVARICQESRSDRDCRNLFGLPWHGGQS